MAISSTELQKFYIAYFGRPMDPNALAFYTAQERSVDEIAEIFSSSGESQALYGNMSASAKVTAIYQSIFGREPEPAGLLYWTNLLDGGSVSPASAALIILQSAQGGDLAVVENKVTAAIAFTAALDTPEEIAAYSGASAAALVRGFLSKVTADSTSIVNLTADVVETVIKLTGTTVTPPTGGGSAPPFAVTVDNDVYTFANAGPTTSVAISSGTSGNILTFITDGASAGTVIIPLNGAPEIVVPAGKVLVSDGFLAIISRFTGPGTVKLSDTTLLATSAVSIDDAVAGLLDLSNVTSISSADLADATQILVTNNGTSGNKVKTAANVEVTIDDTGSATGAELKAIADATTGIVSATSISSMTSASVATAVQLLVTDDSTFLHATDIAVSFVDTTASAADLKAIDNQTTGLVTAASLTGISGTAADVISVLGAVATGTALSAASLRSVTLTGNIGHPGNWANVVFADNGTLVLADVAENYVTTADVNVSAGHTLTVDGSALGAGNGFEFSGYDETDGKFIVVGGAGNDVFYGGQGTDTFTGGLGVDAYKYLSGAALSTLTALDTITDYRVAGADVITLINTTAVASNIDTVQDLSNETSLSIAVDVMASAMSTNDGLGVFLWNGDTYAYVEVSGAGTNYVATDFLVKLTGTPWTAGASISGLGIDGV